MQKLARVHEPKVLATAEAWTQQPWTAHYNQSPQKEMQEMTFHHLQTVQTNSLNNKQEDNNHIHPILVSMQHSCQIHQFDCEVDSGAGYNIMPLYIYKLLFKQWIPQPPSILISMVTPQ